MDKRCAVRWWALAKVMAAGSLALGVLVSAASAAAQTSATDRQTASLVFTTTKPGAPSGSRFDVTWRNPDEPNNPDAKPPAVQTLVVSYAPGTIIDTSAVPQCKASDAELMLFGASACPAASQIGAGQFLTDQGSPSPFPRFITYSAWLFNNAGEQVGFSQSTDPPMNPPVRNTSRGKIDGATITTVLPTFPSGGPPDNPFTALKTMDISGGPISHGRSAYLRSPPSCPASGYWTNTSTFVYHDGVSQTVETHSPCRPR
jgi:hypothetical protein